MKKSLKIFLFIVAIIISIFLGFCFYCFAVTRNVKLDENKLINLENSVAFYDSNGEKIVDVSSQKTITRIEDMPKNLKNAFVSIEDKRFYTHKGIDYKALFRAIFKNISSFSLKEGASTITQQLVKNTHLSSEKTINRKIKEFKLAREIEKNYSKDEIIEKYLNTIYFGDGCYGITKASSRFFNKSVSELTLPECATLAGIVKAPYTYSPLYNRENCIKRRNLVLSEMKKQAYITEAEYQNAISEDLNLTDKTGDKFDYIYLAKKEMGEILRNSPYALKNLKIYTYFEPEKQKTLSEALNNTELKTDKSSIMLKNNNKIIAYSSTVGEINRQLGSTLKPILVYAPAIEENDVSPITPILDEKTNFSGYSPSNYGNVYHGYVSVKEALANSLNTCAVKVLNSTGVNKAFSYLSKTDIKFLEEDKNLSSALGCLKNGATLSEITASYGVFKDNGLYYSPKCINKIVYNGKVIYKDSNKNNKVFSEETAFLTDDMLKETVKTGTAKKLRSLNYDLRAKTGTAGGKNGNTDAYTISYNKNYTLGVWLGNKDYSLMNNEITGANKPMEISSKIWENVYKKENYNKEEYVPDGIEMVYIDKLHYNENNKVVLAEDIAPKEYKILTYFKKDNKPKIKSTRFSSPTIENKEITVNNNEIKIKLCVAEYYNFKIFKEKNGVKKCIYDSIKDAGEIIDYFDGYTYSAVPYFKTKDSVCYGKEEYFNKIKSPTDYIGDDWILLDNL